MTKYGDDLAKTMWSDLCNLADAASMVSDVEQLKDEDKDQRVFRPWLKIRAPRGKPLLQYWPSYMTFFRDYKIAADFKTKTLAQSTRSCKRRGVQERNHSSCTDKSKKAKLGPHSFTWKGKETPNSLLEMMENLNGGTYGARLIFERGLTKTDVEPGQSRLSMPFSLLIHNDFLTPDESRIIEKDINNDNKTGVGAVLVDQRSEKYGVNFKRWEQKRTWNYTLTCGWNDVVEANGLKENDYISVWSFRWRGVLSFALVPALSPNNGT